jgi:hypothetical protein
MITLDLISDHSVQACQLTVKVLMLRDGKRVRAHEVLGTLSHLNSLLEAVSRNLASRNDTIRLDNVAGSGELHAGEVESLAHKSDALTGCANGLQVAKGLADPMYRAAVLAQSLDGLGATGHEDTVEHGGAQALEVVVGLNAATGALVLAIGVDLVSPWADGEGKGSSSC